MKQNDFQIIKFISNDNIILSNDNKLLTTKWKLN